MPLDKKTTIMTLDGKGNGSFLTISQLNEYPGLVWINSDINGIKKLLENLPTQPAVVKEVLFAKETRPRTMIFDDTLLASFRGVNLNKQSTPEDMISVRLLIKKNLIITIQRRTLATINEIECALKEGIGPKTTAEFLDTMLFTMTDKSIQVISNLGDILDKIEDALSEKADTGSRTELNNMRRRIILLRRYLIPQREAISRISIEKLSWLNKTNLMHLREINDSSTRLLEDLDAERERATVIHEEISAQSQEVMNQKMYLLTIIAVIFMPLSFITGLLGINVGGIPGGTFRYGFLTVCLLLVVVFIMQFIYLKKKWWI